MPEFTHMSLSALVVHLKSQGLSLSKQAKLWGVTSLQVHYYKTGKTKQANPSVCMHVYENIKVDSLPVLIDIYKSPEDLQQAYDAYNA